MPDFTQDNLSLYAPQGERKYVNSAERRRVLQVMQRLERERALFSLLLAWTGARVSEVLAVRANSFQIERNVVALRTLKRRRPHVREIPIAPGLMAALDQQFNLRALQSNPETASQRLWPMSRVTAWRVVKGVMLEAGVVGRPACPRGLRHGFCVMALQASVPLNLVQRWAGHARISTTAIYADASGPEERFFAEKFWESAKERADSAQVRPKYGWARSSRRRRRDKRAIFRLSGLAKPLALTLWLIAAAVVAVTALALLHAC